MLVQNVLEHITKKYWKRIANKENNNVQELLNNVVNDTALRIVGAAMREMNAFCRSRKALSSL